MDWNNIPNFCPKITNRFHTVLCRMHVYLANPASIYLLKVKQIDGKVLFNLVSGNIKISTYCVTVEDSISNFLRMEFVFKWFIIILFGYIITEGYKCETKWQGNKEAYSYFSLPLLPASRILRNQPSNYWRELTSAQN